MIRREKLGVQAMFKYINNDVYTELEYLQTNGSQYVNTHLSCNRDSVIQLEHHSYTTSYSVPIISDCAQDGSSTISICRSKAYAESQFGDSVISVVPQFGYELVTVDREWFIINEYRFSFADDIAEFTSGDIYLFTNPVFGFGVFYSRIYSLSITTDGVSYEIIPVLDALGVPCMYNKTLREFYYNEGEGEFEYGLKSDE